MKMINKRRLYNALQWSWGLPQTLAGFALYMVHRGSDHYDYGGAKVTVWDRNDGVSLGKFIFAPDDEHMLSHEYGHTKQSLLLGPLYLPLIGLPSLIWNRLPYFKSYRKKTGKSYDSIIIERSATYLGKSGRGARR